MIDAKSGSCGSAKRDMRGESSVGGVSSGLRSPSPSCAGGAASTRSSSRLRAGVHRVGPRRELTDELYAHALAYPWARPASSFVLRGERADPLDHLDAAKRPRAVAGRRARASRSAGLRLQRRARPARAQFQGVAGRRAGPAGPRRDAPRLRCRAAPMPTLYGALPATIFPSPGSAVRASVRWVSDVELTALAWSDSATGPAGWTKCGSSRMPRTRRRSPACSASSRAGARCASRTRSSRWRPCPPSAARALR